MKYILIPLIFIAYAMGYKVSQRTIKVELEKQKTSLDSLHRLDLINYIDVIEHNNRLIELELIE